MHLPGTAGDAVVPGATSRVGAIASPIVVCRRYGTTAQVDELALPAGVVPEAVCLT